MRAFCYAAPAPRRRAFSSAPYASRASAHTPRPTSDAFKAAVRHGTVVDRGLSVPVTDSGRVDIASLTPRRVPPRWRSAVDAAVDVVEAAASAAGGRVRAVYVRGSVVCNAAAAERSDLDLVVYCWDEVALEAVRFERRAALLAVARRFGLARVDCAVFLAREVAVAEMECALEVQAFGVCVRGEDFVRGLTACCVGRHAGIDVVRDCRVALEEAGRRRGRLDFDGERVVLQWFLKRALRRGAESCARASGRYARDLVPCVCAR
jgi:predicted nucleotidyltransferase